MEHGTFITEGMSDWQIVQHHDGYATVHFAGTWIVIKDAVKIGIVDVVPKIRIVSEEDNSQISAWLTPSYTPDNDDMKTGTWETDLKIPAGGPYRIETSLHVKSVREGLNWVFRGDVRLHVGVGDVFMIAGQSNSAGYGKDTAYDAPELGVHLFRNRHTWDLAAHPFNESTFNAGVANADRGVTGVSPYLAFGKYFKKLSHYPVGLIETAMGGMPIKKWKPNVGGLYKNMVEQAKACGDMAGVLWYQGCSNTDAKGLDGYKENYYEIIDCFRKDIGYDVPFFTFQLNREINSPNDDGYGQVREIQRQASHDIKEVYIIPTLNCSLSDTIHNNAHSNIMLGESLAKLCGHVLYNTTEFFAPEISSAVLNDNIISVTFEHVNGSLLIPTQNPEICGFTVNDDNGTVPYEKIMVNENTKNEVDIYLTEKPSGKCLISYAYEANPTRVLLMDERTYLPPLSFYKYEAASN